MTSSTRLRRALVDALVASGAACSPSLCRAFLEVPRENFVPEIAAARGLEAIYTDGPLTVRELDGVATSSSSQPTVMAQMLEALKVRPGQRVLEVGLGTGYNAALLCRLVGPTGMVTSVDIDEGLVSAASAALLAGGHPVQTAVVDGRGGWPAAAPFDRIMVTASTDVVPYAWWQQLAPDGMLVVPLRLDAMQIIAVFARTATGFLSRQLIQGSFMPLRDSVTAAANGTARVTVRTAMPGKPSTMASAFGPGLQRLSARARRALLGYLLTRPRSQRVGPYPAWPVIWHAALTTDPRRQVSVYLGVPGLRLGVIDPPTGAVSVLVARHRDDDWCADAIETFGPDQHTRVELKDRLRSWQDAGGPTFDRLSVEIDYATHRGRSPRWALRTVRHSDHRICFGWTDPPGPPTEVGQREAE